MSEETFVTKCSDCGGEVIFSAGRTVARCLYCGAPNAMPKKPEQKSSLIYANEQRNHGEFSEAMRAYQDVLQHSPDEVEARWGRLLSKYGVIYVEDKEKRECHITCRRSVKAPIREDHDYEAILALAEPEVREKYKKDAEYIDRVQMKIRILKQQDKPYDVFLCYKETDGSGGRTEDSLRMQGIYNDLTKSGYRVFFARETLKEKTGEDYEAAIFAAIESSSVMLVMGTRKEYFASTWVRSEWRRYLEKLDNGDDKVLLPLFEDAEDLPKEFVYRNIQGYKMEGPYLLDLKSRLVKLLRTEDVRFELVEMFLQLGEFDDAEKLLEEMQKEAPKNARIWLYRAMAAEKIRNEEGFLRVTHRLQENSYFMGAMKCAVGAEKEKLREYLEAAEKNLRKTGEEPAEDRADETRTPFHDVKGSVSSRLRKEWIGGQLALEDGEYGRAAEIFDGIVKADATDALGWLGKLMAEKKVSREEDLARSGAFLAGNKNYERAMRFGDESLRARLAGYEEAVRQRLAYREAEELQQAGKYDEAIAKYEALGSYSDSVAKLEECRTVIREREYREAEALRQAGKYDEAIAKYEALGSYRDSGSKLEEALREREYHEAETLRQAGRYDEAIAKYEALGDYSDSGARIEECRTALSEREYREAEVLRQAGKYDEAIAKYEALGDYSDSMVKIEECRTALSEREYREAETLRQAGKYDEAIAKYEALGGYSDSGAKLKEVLREREYHEAEALRQAGKYDEAIAKYEALGGYSDSGAKREEALREREYHEAEALRQAGKYDEAVKAFTALGGYGDAAVQIMETGYLKAKSLMMEKDHTGAYAVFIGIRGYRDVDSLLANDRNLKRAAREAEYVVGKYVNFGHYPQTKSGSDKTAIEWRVLARDGQKALLLSRYGLEARPYNISKLNVTWKTCSLRRWLNWTFLNSAFSAEERKAIIRTKVDNSVWQGCEGENPTMEERNVLKDWWKRITEKKKNNSGIENNTQDLIFLLSCAEAKRYLGVTLKDHDNTRSRVAPTAYAVQAGAYTSKGHKTADGAAAGWWWLRSPGFVQMYAAGVDTDGSLNDSSFNKHNGCVRPALWLDLGLL